MCLVVQYAYLPENMMLLKNYASKRTLFPNLLKLSHSIKTNGRRTLANISESRARIFQNISSLVNWQLFCFHGQQYCYMLWRSCAYWLLPAVEYPMTFRCAATSRTPSTLSIGSNTRWRRPLQLTSMPILRHTSPGTEGRVYRCGVRTTPRAFERCDWVNLQKSWDLWV